MASNETATQEMMNTQGLSKRELKKLNQTLRLIDKQTNSNEKSHKRNGQHYRKANEGTPRKILKTQALINGEKSQDGSSSVRESMKETEEQPGKPQNDVYETQQKLYNSAYNVEGGQSALFNYILSYNYSQKNAQMDMQEEDWNCLQEIGEEELKPLQNQMCKKATKKMVGKFVETREKLSHLYSRQFKDFSKKYINSAYLLGP